MAKRKSEGCEKCGKPIEPEDIYYFVMVTKVRPATEEDMRVRHTVAVDIVVCEKCSEKYCL